MEETQEDYGSLSRNDLSPINSTQPLTLPPSMASFVRCSTPKKRHREGASCLEDMVADAENTLANNSISPVNYPALIRSLDETIHASRSFSTASTLSKAEKAKQLLHERHSEWLLFLQSYNLLPKDVSNAILDSASQVTVEENQHVYDVAIEELGKAQSHLSTAQNAISTFDNYNGLLSLEEAQKQLELLETAYNAFINHAQIVSELEKLGGEVSAREELDSAVQNALLQWKKTLDDFEVRLKEIKNEIAEEASIKNDAAQLADEISQLSDDIPTLAKDNLLDLKANRMAALKEKVENLLGLDTDAINNRKMVQRGNEQPMNNIHHKFYGLERDVLRRILLLESVELGEIANSMNSSGLESSPAYYTCLEDMVDDAEKSLADTSVVPINDLTLIRSLEESIHTSRDSSSALLLLKAENVKNLLQQRHNQWIALLQKLNFDPEDVKKKLIESSSISHDDVDPHSLAKSHDPIADTNSMEKSRDQALNTLQASNSGGTTSAIVMNQMRENFRMKLLVELVNENKVLKNDLEHHQ